MEAEASSWGINDFYLDDPYNTTLSLTGFDGYGSPFFPKYHVVYLSFLVYTVISHMIRFQPDVVLNSGGSGEFISREYKI